MSDIYVVIPAYDEMENLRVLLPELAKMTKSNDLEVTAVVVLRHEASEDDFIEVEFLGARPIRRGPTDSFGDSLRSGFKEVEWDARYVIVMDADGSHAPATVPRLISAPEAAHVVIASRYINGGSSDNGWALRAASRLLNVVYGRILGIQVRDVSNNFKRYLARDLKSISLECRDFDTVEEILVRLKVLHGSDLYIMEIPDHFHERKLGVTKRKLGPFVLSYLKTLARLRWLLSRSRP